MNWTKFREYVAGRSEVDLGRLADGFESIVNQARLDYEHAKKVYYDSLRLKVDREMQQDIILVALEKKRRNKQ